MSNDQRFELRIVGEVEVIPGPLSKIRAIATDGANDPNMPDDVRIRCAAILELIDGNPQ